MATINQNYANLLTLRFYTALIAPPPVPPSLIPGIKTHSKVKTNKQRQPNDCVGRCIQSKLSKFTMTMQFSEDSFGGTNTPQQEYKRCVNATVSSFFSEEENSECLTTIDYGNIVTQYGLNETPYRTFSLVPSTSDTNAFVFKGESLIMNAAGACDYCLLANKVCSSTKNRNYNQTHKVCQNRIGYSSTNPGPNFPLVSPDIQEHRFSGYNTSWIFREALLGIVNAGGLQFQTNCGCEEIAAKKPTSSIPAISPVVSNAIDGRTTNTIQGTQTSRSVTSRSAPPASGGSY